MHADAPVLLCAVLCRAGIWLQGYGNKGATFPLTNNSVYTVPPDYNLNEYPLMLCGSNSTVQSDIRWLHLNGSAVTTEPFTRLPYYQANDPSLPGEGLWHSSGYMLTALDEEDLICEVSRGSEVMESLLVRVQLPRGETCRLQVSAAVLWAACCHAAV